MTSALILNGVSSAGKSSLARAIQHHAKATFLCVEMDAFVSFLPDGHELKPEWFKIDRVVTDDGELPRISNGPRGAQLLCAMRQFAINAVQTGLDVIVDDVCHAPEIAEYREGLASSDTYFIKVTAPIETLEEREKARGNRLIGLARQQSYGLHKGITYDLEIDTGTASPEALAAQILATLNL